MIVLLEEAYTSHVEVVVQGRHAGVAIIAIPSASAAEGGDADTTCAAAECGALARYVGGSKTRLQYRTGL